MTVASEPVPTRDNDSDVVDPETGRPFHRDESLTEPRKQPISHHRPCGRCNGTGVVLGGKCFDCGGNRIDVFQINEWAVPTGWTSERIAAWQERRAAKNQSRRRRRRSATEQKRSLNLAANRAAFPDVAAAMDRIEREDLAVPVVVKQLLAKARTRSITSHEAKTIVDVVAVLEPPPIVGNFIGTVGQPLTLDLDVLSISEQTRSANRGGGQPNHYEIVFETLFDDPERVVWVASRNPGFPEGSIVRLKATVHDHRKTDDGDETVIVDVHPQGVPAGYELYRILIAHDWSRTDAMVECRSATPVDVAILKDKLDRITRPDITEPVPADWAEALDQAEYTEFVDTYGQGVTPEEAATLAVLPDQESITRPLFDDDFVTD